MSAPSFKLKISFLFNDFKRQKLLNFLMLKMLILVFFFIKTAFISPIYNLIFFLQASLNGLWEPVIVMVVAISGALWGVRSFSARSGANVSLVLKKDHNARVLFIDDVNRAKALYRIVKDTSPNDRMLRGQQL